MKRNVLLLPLLIFLLIAAALLWQLARNAQGDDPTNLESALTGKPVPAFRLESLETPGQYYQAEVLTQGKPVLLNVWATWCPTCRAEHQYLNQLSAQGIRVVGLNYKDDRAKAVAWLKELGNPYALSLSDSDGMLGLDLGVSGAAWRTRATAAVNHCRRPDETQRTVITAADFSADCRGAAVAAGAQRAGG
ncbi:DsbE family thiol:disulfide interchange protein [Salmonella enterica]|uniref:DsbE family thiol:disulfide interchange protein n=1 Tax=Salmonella enterica TaxID=28901 RepID=UPI0023B90467|nr:DsbE family thiol:disulfide interchange protein [Salmonella enterica]